MPPKPKYTKEQIIETALNVVSQKGVQALTAKELGNALGMSTSPIFTVFDSMQEVQDEVRRAAMERFEVYAHRQEKDIPLFKQIGMQMIQFAKEESHLYQLIFMSPESKSESFDDIYTHLGNIAEECLNALQADYALSKQDSKTLFEHTWIHTFAIGTLCATGMYSFSEEHISNMLTEDFTAMMMLIKANRYGENKCQKLS